MGAEEKDKRKTGTEERGERGKEDIQGKKRRKEGRHKEKENRERKGK